MSSGAERSRRYRQRRNLGLEACEYIGFSRKWRTYLVRDGRITEYAGDKEMAEALEELLEDVRPMLAKQRHVSRD